MGGGWEWGQYFSDTVFQIVEQFRPSYIFLIKNKKVKMWKDKLYQCFRHSADRLFFFFRILGLGGDDLKWNEDIETKFNS